ncbi:hypothetical protein RRF57_010998 [Xylaria bambusicola]|uniref:Uncharacterized protein n=1 Tax=Xylaria bambusicola TaxID=326684 RepID=A0AAN7ZCV1_9PEZI
MRKSISFMGCGALLNASEAPALIDLEVAQCSLYNATYTVDFNFADGAQNIRPVVSSAYNDLTQPLGLIVTVWPQESGLSPPFTSSLIEAYSFAAIMDSFARILAGSIYNYDRSLEINSPVSITALLRTKKFSFLNAFNLTKVIIPELWNGLSVSQPTSFTRDWLGTIEEMFQNATISMMGSELLR